MGRGGGWVGEIGLAPDMLPWSCVCMSAFSFGYQQTHVVSKCKCVFLRVSVIGKYRGSECVCMVNLLKVLLLDYLKCCNTFLPFLEMHVWLFLLHALQTFTLFAHTSSLMLFNFDYTDPAMPTS